MTSDFLFLVQDHIRLFPMDGSAQFVLCQAKPL